MLEMNHDRDESANPAPNQNCSPLRIPSSSIDRNTVTIPGLPFTVSIASSQDLNRLEAFTPENV